MRALDLSQIPKPAFDYAGFQEWRGLIPEAPLTVEIGCGVGLHPIRWAQAHPHAQLLAIERTKEKYDRFKGRLQNHPHLKNLWPAHADAGVLLPHLFSHLSSTPVSPSSYMRLVDSYYVLYPNPYPKASHRSRRFAHSPLTRFMSETLKPQGTIEFATNIASYADELARELPHQLPLKLEVFEPIPFENPPRTHFEKKYLARGETCFRLIFSSVSI